MRFSLLLLRSACYVTYTANGVFVVYYVKCFVIIFCIFPWNITNWRWNKYVFHHLKFIWKANPQTREWMWNVERFQCFFFFFPKIHKTNEHNTHINLVKGILCRNKLLLTAKWKKGRSSIDCISRKHIHAIKTPTHGKVNKKSIFIYHLPWMAMSSAKIKQKLLSESDVGRQKEWKWNRIHKRNVIYQIITAFK